MRCQCVLLSTARPGARIHIFAMPPTWSGRYPLHLAAAADGPRLTTTVVPVGSAVPGLRRSWLLGFVTAVITRVRSAEDARPRRRKGNPLRSEHRLVLADRAIVIRRQLEQAYPVTRRTRVTYSGRGYNDGYAQGQRLTSGTAEWIGEVAQPRLKAPEITRV